VEYVLIGGVNDSPAVAHDLGSLLQRRGVVSVAKGSVVVCASSSSRHVCVCVLKSPVL
jgi:hypothetical protein